MPPVVRVLWTSSETRSSRRSSAFGAAAVARDRRRELVRGSARARSRASMRTSAQFAGARSRPVASSLPLRRGREHGVPDLVAQREREDRVLDAPRGSAPRMHGGERLALRRASVTRSPAALEPGVLDLAGRLVAVAARLDVVVDQPAEVELVVRARDRVRLAESRSISPRSSSIARSQKRSTAPMSCVTKMIVLPSALSWWNWSKHFCWNAASPTASTSSTSSTSASTWTATENAEPHAHARTSSS